MVPYILSSKIKLMMVGNFEYLPVIYIKVVVVVVVGEELSPQETTCKLLVIQCKQKTGFSWNSPQ